MSRFITVLAESFKLLLKKPKLFLPKILIAVVYGASMLLIAQLYLQLYSIDITGIALKPISPETAMSILILMALNIILLVFAFLLDILINGMYPPMVDDYFAKRKISFTGAIKKSFGRFHILLSVTLLDLAVFIAVMGPLAVLFNFALLSNNYLIISVILLIIGALTFATIVIFYFLYPVAMLEKEGIISTILNSFKSSRRNLGTVSKAALIPFFFTIINFALAFLQENLGFLLLFVAMRLIVAAIATYHYVLNPVVYLEYEKKAVVK